MSVAQLNQHLGNIDLYLLDAILKGYINTDGRVLDAGCGEGRNLHWLLKQGYDCWGVDANELAILLLQQVAKQFRPGIEAERFQGGLVEKLLFPAGAFSTVICSAVLHFALTEDQFRAQWRELCRVLLPGGFLFVRTATNWGMPDTSLVAVVGNQQHHLPDGSQRFLLTNKLLASIMKENNLEFKEGPKSVLLPGLRSMGVFMFQKSK